MKIDMANEVIDAGRFDMQTSMEERKQTLEALLQVWSFMSSQTWCTVYSNHRPGYSVQQSQTWLQCTAIKWLVETCLG